MSYDILNAEQLLNPQLVSYVRYLNPEVKFGYTCHAGFNFMHFQSTSKFLDFFFYQVMVNGMISNATIDQFMNLKIIYTTQNASCG